MDLSTVVLRQLYTFGSLSNADGGYRFRVTNRLSRAALPAVESIRVDGRIAPLDGLTISGGGGSPIAACARAGFGPVDFPLRQEVEVRVAGEPPPPVMHRLAVAFETQRECLAALGCSGTGRVRKRAETVGGVAPAGEISLAAAISSLGWVSSHERYGRNR